MHVTLSMEGGPTPDLAKRSHRFDEAGGVIGRDPAADWVLPDKRNVVSGQHMRIGFAGQRFSVTDTSRNGTSLNGRPIGTNQSVALADGDRLRIGDYEFVARLEDVALLREARTPEAAWTPPSVHGGSLGVLQNALVDPEAPSARDSDPLLHLAAVTPQPSRASGFAAAPRSVGAGRFGGDDDFAGLFDDTPGEPDTASLIDPGPFQTAVMTPVGALGASSTAAPPAAALPAAPPPAAAPPAAAPMEAVIIPLPLPPPPFPAPLPPTPEPPAVIGEASGAASPAAAPLIPEDWAADFGGLMTPQPKASAPLDLATFPLRPLEPPAPIPLRPIPTDAAPVPAAMQDAALLLQRREAARNPPEPVAPAPPSDEAANQLAALWTALGVDPARLSAKERQRFLGELGLAVREMSEGLIGVLGMRQTIKAEFRMERTMVGSTENNLFKFTRNADELLALAVSNANKVFLPLDRAVRGAFNDIKAHEMSTLSAVQLSIRSVLDRFNPAKIEKQAQEQRRGFGFASLKATCWEHFSADYGSLAGDADEASNRIFATELARAYRERTAKPDA